MRVGRCGAGLVAVVLAVSLVQVPALAGAQPAAAEPAAPVPEGQASEQDALTEARRSGQPVEVLSQRSEHRTVRALPSGRLEATEHLRPIRTRQDGKWVDIDTTLRASGAQIVPGATAVGLRLSAGGDGPLVRMSKAGRELSLTWPQPLPEPALDGDTAVYRGVLGPDVDLRVRAEPEGFAHTFVVKTAEAAQDPRLARLAFGLAASRLSVTEGADGLLQAKDATSGAGVFEAPAPVMWDSTQPEGAQARTGTQADADEGPAEGAKTAPVQVSVDGGQLALTPDQGLLTSPDTTFPVYIDPVWQTSAAYAWGMVSSGFPDQTYYKFAGKSTEGMGRCLVSVDPTCVKDQTKRLFYRMKLPAIKGTYIESAEFVAYETHAYDCSNGSTVELWRATALSSSATWNNTSGNWGTLLDYRDVAYCSRTPVEFGGATLRSHVQSAVDKGYTTITFGLKAYRETTMSWWKRFADDAYLRVQYNRPPNQSDTDTMFANPGTKCLPAGQEQPVNDIPTVYAYLFDPDTEDAAKVQGQFTLHWANNPDGSDWGEKWTSALTPALTSGSRHEIKLPSTIPQRTRIGWGVRAYDGAQYGPWSYSGAQTGCYFIYDPAVPAAPTVTSADYPADGTSHGGVGEAGTFTISDSAHVATRYDLTLNSRALPSVTTTAGAARQVQVVPDRSGPNQLTVQAFTQAGQNTESTTYEFLAKAGADPVARFSLNEPAGSPQVTASSPGIAARLRGTAELGAGGKSGTALSLDGVSGFAESTLPVVDTTESFSVSAWVKPTQTKIGDVLAQTGTFQGGFYLGMQPSGVPVLKWPSTDTNDGGGAWQNAQDDTPLPLGEWSHLTGVYDKDAAQMRLYVNGQLQATVNNATTLDTHGAVQIGRSFYNGTYVNYWPGSIDDVQVFTEPLSDAQAGQLAAGSTPEGTGRVAHWNMDEPQGDVRVYSPAAPITASVHGGTTLGADGQEGSALRLNGVDGSAGTGTPVINTSRSFSVAAWVWMDSLDPARNLSVLSQDGAHRSGFFLKYNPTQNKWLFARFDQDSDVNSGVGYTSYSREPAKAGAWTHLAGVWDETTKRLRLFVNGEPMAESAEMTSVWSATGGLQIGRALWQSTPADYFSGVIDDVRIYDRIVGAQEIEEMFTQHPVLKARWAMNDQPVDSRIDGEPAGAPAMTLAGGAAIDPDVGFKSISLAGLSLNGSSAYADTAVPPVRTDDSFTIAGWVYNLGRPTTPRTVFSQAGANTNAFALRYVPDPADPVNLGGWQLEMNNTDQADATPRIAVHSGFNDQDWDHIAIVYDALRDRMSLFVNGALEETEGGLSQEDEALGFAANNGGLQVGRSKFGAAGGTEFWPGAVDDVWAYQGALTATQVKFLAESDELPTEDGP